MTYAETIASMEMETKDVTVFQISTPHDTFYGVEYDITFVDDDENRYEATIKNKNRIMKDLDKGSKLTIKFHVKDSQMMPEQFTEINYVIKEN